MKIHITKITAKILFSTLLFLMISCQNNDKKTEKQAMIDLDHIQSLINSEDYQQAKTAIDSFHVLYRKHVNLRKKADILTDTIDFHESNRIIQSLSTILSDNKLKINQLEPYFKFEKNDRNDNSGTYSHKNTDAVSNANRNYLKTYFNHDGLFFLESNYCGKKINQNEINISSKDENISSGILSTGHYYDVQGEHFESLGVTDSIAEKMAAFIATNLQQTLKVNIRGKSEVSYILSAKDKQIISDTYQYWKLKTETEKIEKEITRASKRIQIIQLKKP